MASSHTLSPTFQGEKVLVSCSLMIRWADLCMASGSFLPLSRVVRQFSNVGRKVFLIGG